MKSIKCKLCGKTIKKNSLISSISIGYAMYEGQIYSWNDDIRSKNVNYWEVCSSCTNKVVSFLEGFKEARGELDN